MDRTIPQQQDPRIGEKETDTAASPKWLRGVLIGTGAWSKSKSYLGMNSITGEFLVVKEIKYSEVDAKPTSDKDTLIRMRCDLVPRLIDIVTHLEHPNVVRYFGDDQEDDMHSILMEYLPGGSLRNFVQTNGKLQASLASGFVRQILLGLAYLHGEGIVHRDIKSSKILLDNNGTCKINWTFKMEKVGHAYGPGAETVITGNRYWLAPEVVRSEGKGYTGKADIWCLGCLLLELLSGRQPFSKDDLIASIHKQGGITETPPIPDDVAAESDGIALAFMNDCWALDLDERPTAETLLSAPFVYISSPNTGVPQKSQVAEERASLRHFGSSHELGKP